MCRVTLAVNTFMAASLDMPLHAAHASHLSLLPGADSMPGAAAVLLPSATCLNQPYSSNRLSCDSALRPALAPLAASLAAVSYCSSVTGSPLCAGKRAALFRRASHRARARGRQRAVSYTHLTLPTTPYV